MDDPLNINIPLAGVDTKFPLAPEADYPLQVVKSSVGPNYDKTGNQWDLVFGLTTSVPSVDGKTTLKAGTQLFPDWPLQLQPRADGKGGAEWDGSAAQRSLCATVDALFGSDMETRPAFNRELIDSAVGRNVIGHVVIDTDKNGVQRNKVTRLKKAA
jgi:hypothetical protein